MVLSALVRSSRGPFGALCRAGQGACRAYGRPLTARTMMSTRDVKPEQPEPPRMQGHEALMYVSRKKKNQNAATAAGLVGIVLGIFFYTMYRMKEGSEMDAMEKELEEEAKVNLHKSGLKISDNKKN